MSKELDKIKQLIEKHAVKFIDLRFCDTAGKEQHVTMPISQVSSSFLTQGKPFDGSSIAGWKGINESDMLLMPDASTAAIDPFYEAQTLFLRCDVIEPGTMKPYSRDPRSLARRAETYLRSTGIADIAYFGPEPEFFVFDDVRWGNSLNEAYFHIDSEEGSWNSGTRSEDGNTGHRPRTKGGYFPVPPVDSMQDLRSAMCSTLEDLGIPVEVHHHEVATAGQAEIDIRFNTLLNKADEMMVFKYVVHNIAHDFGKTATFMPKPLVGDNGNGMHVHQSLAKGNKNLFVGDRYGELSEMALFYIGGIFKHARAINALTNASTNSYKRLVPGYEAPVLLAYSSRNRSASCRIPWATVPEARRVEVRFPDPCCNPYLAFSALLMAGLDGIQNRIDPGEPLEKNLYDLPPEEQKNVPHVASSLGHALEELDKDREFLKMGDVFNDDMIDGYIELKQQEVDQLSLATHPLEFDLYYSM